MSVMAGVGSVRGLTTQVPKRRPTVTGPRLLPKKKTISRQVFLEPEMWEELKDTAKFHSDVFDAMEASETVSRNDLIESFLRWALDAYWEDKGGRPTSEKDRNEKVKRHAEALRKTPQK